MQGAIPATFIADSIQKHSTKTNIGAHSIFLGQVRNDLIDNKEVAAIDYTTYQDMAWKKCMKSAKTSLEIRPHVYARIS
jgi:molybdopterin synthase catalytic subunit